MTQVYDILDKVRDRLRDNPNVFTVTFERSVVNFTIALMCLDIVDYNKEKYDDDIFYGNTNLQDVYNTQLQVVNDVVQSVRRGSLFDSKIQLIGEPSATPFQDRYENELAGWGIEIQVSMINDISIC